MKRFTCSLVLIFIASPAWAQLASPSKEDINKVLAGVENARTRFLGATENLVVPPSSVRSVDGTPVDLAEMTRNAIAESRRSAITMAQQIRRLRASDEIQASELFPILLEVSNWLHTLPGYFEYAPGAAALPELLNAWQAAGEANKGIHVLFYQHLLAQELELDQCRSRLFQQKHKP